MGFGEVLSPMRVAFGVRIGMKSERVNSNDGDMKDGYEGQTLDHQGLDRLFYSPDRPVTILKSMKFRDEQPGDSSRERKFRLVPTTEVRSIYEIAGSTTATIESYREDKQDGRP